MRRIVCALGFIGLFACSEPSLTEKKVLALKKMDVLITADHLISDVFPVLDQTGVKVLAYIKWGVLY